MDEFISMVTEKLGVGESESRSATAGILGVIKEHLDESSFGSLLEKLPGAESLLNDAEPQAASSGGGGGMFGALSSLAGGLFGGKGGAAAGIAAAIGGSGLGMDKISDFVQMLVGFLKDKLGEDTFQSLLSNVPGLSDADKS